MSQDQSGKHEHVSDTTIRDLARGRFTGTETARKNNIARITECAECTAKYNDPVFINPPMAKEPGFLARLFGRKG